MKKLVATFLFSTNIILLSAQHFAGLDTMKCPIPLEKNHVQLLSEDSLSSSFLIWVKVGVPYHFHASHTEQVYVLEGEGVMTMADSSFTVKAGDYIFIPKGVPHGVIAYSTLKVLSIQTPRWITDDRIFIDPIRRPHNE